MLIITKLESFKARLVEYLNLKVEQEDWHGVSDAANDIREIEARLGMLRELEANGVIKLKSPYMRPDDEEHINRILTNAAVPDAERSQTYMQLKYKGKL